VTFRQLCLYGVARGRSGHVGECALWRFAVATRVFTDAELDRLRSFPEINPDELIRFFTPTKSGCP
jgi:hypothetical protein